jgi:NAD(P)H-dependent flavin oxidoreductase YrpB (nitropropane dioxygenase family)
MTNSLQSIRGTLILADQVYRTDQGKWIIAGTYTHWQTPNDELVLHSIQAYIRLQVERPSTYPMKLTMMDRGAPPNARPMLEANAEIAISEAQVPVFEMALHLPELRIPAPIPAKDRQVGSVLGIRTLLWLTVSGTDVASCHLDFHFTKPAELPPRS